MYIVVTGAAGFVGSNVVKALNARGETGILAVDNLTRADKFRNLADCEIADYLDKEHFRAALDAGSFDGEIAAILHQGACSDTMQTDGRYMMENNYRYSVDLLAYCQSESVPLIYASSASVYGSGAVFKEGRENEKPLNVYGFSKFLFDQLVRRRWEDNTAQVAGLRYFNVYGPRESHKERMASVAFHCFNQFRETGKVKLFEGSGGYAAGEQRRDFISIEDVVKVNLYFLDNPRKTGIFNCGTGASQTFNDIAVATINALRRAEGKNPHSLAELRSQGMIEYVSFPAGLREKYQSYTQADLAQLRGCGYAAPFFDVETGVTRYVEWLLDAAP
ncbi:MAG TPA: ADP-glyceromanno-heptose 6-epimerase [Burkholderiales bacterium]|nr:ADP-glyceromanno-heptose 6-epimerase [Burkholderiales bacterium]